MDEQVAKLIPKFRTLDQSIKISLSEAAKSPMIVGIATLILAHNLEGITHLSAANISHLLEEAGVAVTTMQISKAFARAGNHITRTKVDGEVHFRAMTSTRTLVEPILSSGPIQVVRIEAGTPRTARKKLEELFAQLSGTLRICDPYYGLRTLDALALIPKSFQVRFLTSRTNEKSTSLVGPLNDFKREFPNFQIRVLTPPTTLHDRYILSQDSLMLLGHGVKDIGSKESFVVVLTASYARDLLNILEATFDQYWTNSTVL